MAKKKQKTKPTKKKQTKSRKVKGGKGQRVRRVPKVVGTREKTNKNDQTIIVEEVVKERRRKRPKSFAQKRAEQFAKTGVADLAQLRQQRQIASQQLGYATQSSDPLTLRSAGRGRYNQAGGVAGFADVSNRYAGGNLITGNQQQAVRRRVIEPQVRPTTATIETQTEGNVVGGEPARPRPQPVRRGTPLTGQTIRPKPKPVRRSIAGTEISDSLPVNLAGFAGDALSLATAGIGAGLGYAGSVMRDNRRRRYAQEEREEQRQEQDRGLIRQALRESQARARRRARRDEQFSQFGDTAQTTREAEEREERRVQAIRDELERQTRELQAQERRQQSRRTPRTPQPQPEPERGGSISSSDSDSSGGSLGGGRGVRIKPPQSRRLSPTEEGQEPITFFSDATSSIGDFDTPPAVDRFSDAPSTTGFTDPSEKRYQSETLSLPSRGSETIDIDFESEVSSLPSGDIPVLRQETPQTEEEEQRERRIFFADRPDRPDPQEQRPPEATGRLLRRQGFAPPVGGVRGGPQGLEDTPLQRRTIGSRDSAFRPTQAKINKDLQKQIAERREQQAEEAKEVAKEQAKEQAPVSSRRGRGRPADTRSIDEIGSEITTLESQVETLKSRLDDIVSRAGRPFQKGKLNPRSNRPEAITEVGAYVDSFIENTNADRERRGNPPLSAQDEADLRQTAEDIMSARIRLNQLRALRGGKKKKKK